jgi:hypothetical protein
MEANRCRTPLRSWVLAGTDVCNESMTDIHMKFGKDAHLCLFFDRFGDRSWRGAHMPLGSKLQYLVSVRILLFLHVLSISTPS